MVNLTNNTILANKAINTTFGSVNPLILEVITAIIIILVGVIIGKFVEKLFMKLFDLMDLNKLFNKTTGFKADISKILSKLSLYAVYIIAIVLGLNRVGITSEVIRIIIFIIVLVIILVLVLGINDVFANFFAGFMIRKKFNVGDFIEIKEKNKKISGRVIHKGLLKVRIDSKGDELIFVPNTALLKSRINIKK